MTSSPLFSVIICTYNPRLDYLGRVLVNVGAQTLARDQWEVILVDNRSEPPVEGRLETATFRPDKVVREETAGLVAARSRGLSASCGKWLVFVDDDNVLKEDYLEELQRLIAAHPHVAMWLAEIRPEFETQPPEEFRMYWPFLAIREVTRTQWSNIPVKELLGCGAGMAVKREVMEKWTNEIKADPLRAHLGRKQDSLLAAEDTDIGYTACDMGLGVGESKGLQVTHLIPPRRLKPSYLRKIVYSVSYSHAFLDLVRQRVAFLGLCLKIVLAGRDFWSSRRHKNGAILWWFQVRGTVAAWRDFQTRSKAC